MSYRQPGKMSALAGSALSSRKIPNQRNNYGSAVTGKWRHQYVTNAPFNGTPATLPLGEYFSVRHTRFTRTFSSATGDDVPPTPTVSNNLGNPLIFNGSRVENFHKKIRLKNTSPTVNPTIDIYEVALSFYDALIWDTIFPTKCPVTFNTTVPLNPPYDQRGEVQPKVPTTALINAQDIQNFKFLQHYIKLVGTVTLGNTDGDNVGEFIIDRVPDKVKRSQTGMFWGHFFVYDALKNTAVNASLEYSEETSFDELPSDRRLPYID